MDRMLVLDFGGQYDRLIARRVRAENVFAEIKRFGSLTCEAVRDGGYSGIIFTGGPNSVNDPSAPHFDPRIDPVEDIVREKAGATAVFTTPVRSSYFAVEIGRGQCGFFPAGTRVLLRWPDAPGNGDTVLAKLREKNEFLFAVYTRKSGKIVLTPLQGSGGKHIIPKAEFHSVFCWIVPIREAVQLF